MEAQQGLLPVPWASCMHKGPEGPVHSLPPVLYGEGTQTQLPVMGNRERRGRDRTAGGRTLSRPWEGWWYKPGPGQGLGLGQGLGHADRADLQGSRRRKRSREGTEEVLFDGEETGHTESWKDGVRRWQTWRAGSQVQTMELEPKETSARSQGSPRCPDPCFSLPQSQGLRPGCVCVQWTVSSREHCPSVPHSKVIL